MTGAALLPRLAPTPLPGARAERGRAWLEAHELPTGREEAWRYTPVAEILKALEAAEPAPPPPSMHRADLDTLVGDHGGARLVFVNGVLVPDLSDLDTDVAGLWLGGAEQLRPRRAPGAPAPDDEPADGFHALNWAAGRDVAAVMVDPGADADAAVHVVHITAPGASLTASHPRTVVRLGAGSRARLIETYLGLGGPAVTNASTRILLAEEASLTHHRIVVDSPEAIHVGRTAVEQAARSSLRATTIVVGALIARNALEVKLAGDGARVELNGLYAPTGHQRHDNVVTVDHAASHGTSTQRYKGIVDDHGRGSFSGHVIVRPGTVGTDAAQANPNLVLARTAQADTRPWLEILADDVRCTHGATVGRLDHDALFYLRSRGIPLAEARRMLVDAFAAEILEAITPASLRDHVAKAFAAAHRSEP